MDRTGRTVQQRPPRMRDLCVQEVSTIFIKRLAIKEKMVAVYFCELDIPECIEKLKHVKRLILSFWVTFFLDSGVGIF